jgi:hypothetical protein
MSDITKSYPMKEKSMTTTRHGSRGALTFFSAAFVLLVACLLGPPAARAQWTPPDASNNISNTNTGNVGVGTPAPSAALHVVSRAAGNTAVKVKGAAGQTANLLEFRAPDDALRAFVTSGGGLVFNPAMDQVPSAITLAPTFNGQYYASAEHNTFVINGANMANYGLYTNPTVRMFLIKDVNGYNAVEVNKIGMTTFRGDMRNRPWVANINVDSSGAYYAATADGLLINGTGLNNHGIYSGGTVRLLRVVGTGEALAVTRENLTGFGTLSPGARVEILGTGNTSATASLSVRSSAASPLLFVRDDGNVGVGTAGPAHKLDVAGNVNASGLCLGGSCKSSWSEVGGGQWASSGTADISSTNAGNVGVGVPSPAAKLHVGGGGRLDGGAGGRVYLGTGAVVGARGLELMELNATTFAIRHHDPNVAWRNIAINPHGGKVGVGTANPLGPLSVGDSSVEGSDGFLVIGKKSGPGTRHYRVGFDANFNFVIGDYGGNNAVGAWTSPFAINWQAPSGSFYINSAGNVGVGTSSPGEGYKLDVNGAARVTGNMTVDGNIAAKYQDVAEWVPSTQELSAGTVVVLDAARSNHVVASAAAYDTKVAGVISETPGVILGVGGEGKLKVATTGRVKVRVDASRGAILVGDLLVTSEVEGVAMKSVPLELGGTRIHRPGTIIGKALEPLEKGVGEILVLLSLQ